MTVSMQITKRIYQGNGSARRWDVDFPLISADDLAVYLTSPQGVEEELFSDFSVDLLSHTLTYPTEQSGKAPLAEGWKLTVLRKTPLTQDIDLLRQGELDAEVLEQGYDKLTMLVQELSEKVDRSIKYPVSSQESNLETENFLKNILDAKQEALLASSQAAEASRQAQQSADTASQTAQGALEDIDQALADVSSRLQTQGNEICSQAQVQADLAREQAEQARYYAQHSIGKCIGEVYFSQSKAAADNPGSLPLWTGEFYQNAQTLYPEFYAWVKSHPELCKTKQQYDEALAAYGECPFYVADETAGSLRLPKLVNYVKNATSDSGISQSKNNLLDSPDGTSGYTTLFAWVCAYNSAVPASTAQAAEFTNALSGKLNTDLSNASRATQPTINAMMPAAMDYVVEQFADGNGSWYRLYKNGWLEQGGEVTTSLSGTVPVSFLKPFANDKYCLLGTRINPNSIGGNTVTLQKQGTTGFNANSSYITERRADPVSWYACGQGA